MTEMTIIMKGALVADSPIHIVTPNSRNAREGDYGAVSECAYELVYHNGAWTKVACITSSTFRGAVRRAAVDEAWGLGPDAAKKPTIDDYIYAAVGGIKGKEKEVTESVHARARRRELNAVVGLFGASTPWDRGRAMTPALTADPDMIDRDAYGREGDVKPSQVIGARRTDDMVTRHGLEDLLDGDPMARWDEMRSTSQDDSTTRQDIKKLQQKRRSASTEGKADIDKEIKKLNESLSGSNSLLLPFGHQVMPAGTPLSQEIVLARVSEVEAGLFLAALDRLWSENPAFGGKKSHGYGLVSGQWDVTIKQGRRFEDGGHVKVTPYVGMNAEASPEAQRLLKVWDDHLAAVKAGEAEMDLRMGAA